LPLLELAVAVDEALGRGDLAVARLALAEFEAACDGAWEHLDEVERRAFGQVYTPIEVVDTILDDVGFDGRKPGRLLDPACGTGTFLARAADRILTGAGPRPAAGKKAHASVEAAILRVLTRLAGIEIRPETAGLARKRLALKARLAAAETGLPWNPAWPEPAVLCADALASEALGKVGARPGFRWIVGNPPYLEAKRAEEADKTRWRERFPGRVEGAFDLYVCFLELALELASPDGEIGLIVPNKFLVNRYARSLRRRLLTARPPRTLRDMSHLAVFRKTGVYPITLHLGPPSQTSPEGPVVAAEPLPLRAFEATGPSCTWFIPSDPVLGCLIARLLTSKVPRLGEHLQFRSTVSFHQKGLREKYVSKDFDLRDLAYLGGKSWMRRKEVAPFKVDWDGYGIRYAVDELAAIGNPLPPLANFRQAKIIFCQHARRLMAFWDEEGFFVTKDVYPIALAPANREDPEIYTAAWTALLNSKVLSVLFGVLFRGIAIGGGYYHFLPAFLDQIPCPRPSLELQWTLAPLTEALQHRPDPMLVEMLDTLAYELFGLAEEEIAAVEQAFAAWCTNDDPVTRLQSSVSSAPPRRRWPSRAASRLRRSARRG
jgi:SAM-dependent methyltransferase